MYSDVTQAFDQESLLKTLKATYALIFSKLCRISKTSLTFINPSKNQSFSQSVVIKPVPVIRKTLNCIFATPNL